MALSCTVGTFACSASTGNQSVTGLGFQPKAVLFIASEQTADGSSADAVRGIGWATSSSSRHATACTAVDAQGTSAAYRYANNNACIASISNAGSIQYLADFVSMDTDGFTVNWSSVVANSLIGYLALGGADLTNAAVKNWLSPTATGNNAQTGVGFEPDAMLILGSLCLNGELASVQTNMHFGMGAAISSSERATYGSFSKSNADTTDANIKQITTKCFTILNNASVFHEADHVSMDADGFTLNWSAVGGGARNMSALCLKGGQFKIGTETQKTSTGTKATTGVGFQPTGLFLFGGNRATSTSVQADRRLSLGVASSTSARMCRWGGDTDNVGTSVVDDDLDTAAVLKHLTEGTPTLNAEADLSSFDSGGFTLNWGTADATAREFVYVAFGSTAVAGGGNPLAGSLASMGVGW